jgi:uncharacterized protein YeaO (DUF488 family)
MNPANLHGMALARGRIRLKRIYDEPAKDDGTRILVDRLWPRGLTRDAAKIDHWLRELGPSDELRGWYGHEPERWPEFAVRYARELKDKTALLDQIRAHAKTGAVTLLVAAKDMTRSNGAVIQNVLTRRQGASKATAKRR